jgi:hypothetical protein
MTSAFIAGPKHVRISKSEIDKFVKEYQNQKHSEVKSLPPGSQINYTCRIVGCGLVFNEEATQGIEILIGWWG